MGNPPSPWTSDLGTPLPQHPIWNPRLTPLLVTYGDHHCRPVQTCSFEDTPWFDIWWWLLRHVWSVKQVVRILLECFLVVCLFWFIVPPLSLFFQPREYFLIYLYFLTTGWIMNIKNYTIVSAML